MAMVQLYALNHMIRKYLDGVATRLIEVGPVP